MEKKDTSPVYASPKEVAGTIAAVYGERPALVSVSMVGSEEVEDFVSQIIAAQHNAHKVPLDLD